MAALLEVEGLDVYYGAVHALKGVSLRAEAGEIVTLIGANGAGKTTLLRTLSGLIPPRAGRMRFDTRDITRCPPHEVVALGVSHAPEGRLVFANLTVDDNLELGAYRRRDRDGIKKDREEAFRLFPRLGERRRQSAGTLSGGEQQMLAIARALMLAPKLMLLDEPSFGLAPLLVVELFQILRRINEAERVSMLLVEQNASMALDLADHAYLIETGRVVLGGKAAELKSNDSVRKSYLGY